MEENLLLTHYCTISNYTLKLILNIQIGIAHFASKKLLLRANRDYYKKHNWGCRVGSLVKST